MYYIWHTQHELARWTGYLEWYERIENDIMIKKTTFSLFCSSYYLALHLHQFFAKINIQIHHIQCTLQNKE